MTRFLTRHRHIGDRDGLTRKAFLEAAGAAAVAALWPSARPRAQPEGGPSSTAASPTRSG